MTTATTTLADFLLARIGEDEAAARAEVVEHGVVTAIAPGVLVWHNLGYPMSVGPAMHVSTERSVGIQRSERVLAECAAKRAIVGMHSGWHVCPSGNGAGYTDHGDGSGDEWEPICPTLRALAAVYAEHEDYRAEWAL